jgi:hypothetical protein
MIELKDKSRKEIQELLQRGGLLTHTPTGDKLLVLLTKKHLADMNGDYWITVWAARTGTEGICSTTIYKRRKNYEYTA